MTVAGLRILVVEDEPIIALALEDMLIEAGAEALVAERIDDAFALLDQHRVDAAILDVNLHGGRSYPLARALAEQRLPFIFATGYGAAEHPPEFAAVPTIPKPYNLADIAEALEAAQPA